MKLKLLDIEGFKSFGAPSYLDLQREPGLYYLKGENLVEPNLGSNGAGKSTIWDALCWLFYDRSARNLRAGSIESWSSDVRTSVTLTTEDAEYARLRDPIRLAKGDTAITQDELLADVGMTQDAFLHAVLISQFRPMFFDLSPAEKGELVASVLDLNHWSKCSNEAATRSRTLSSSIAEVESKLARAEGALGELDVDKIQWEVDGWAMDAEVELAKVKAEALVASGSLGEAEAEFKRLEAALSAEEQAKEALARAMDASSAHLKKWDELRTHQSVLSITSYRACTAAEDELAALKAVGAECPECGQALPEGKLERIEQRLRTKIADLLDRGTGHEALIGSCEVEILEEQYRAEPLHDLARAADAGIRSLREKVDAVLAQRISAQMKSQLLGADIRRLSEAENPHTARLEAAVKRQRELAREIKLLKRSRMQLETVLSRTQYWVKGFKDLRLFLISEAIGQLEMEVNGALSTMGMEGWSVALEMDRVTADGRISKGFNVLVRSPHNREAVPWEAWSGGEGQRLRLAGTMGLASLILDRTPGEWNVEVWDEPSTWMSAEGVEGLLDTLRDRALRLGKQVWVVDHHSLSYGGFAGVVTVVKDEQGSRIIN